MVYGHCGLLDEIESLNGKGYVEMSTIDPDTSADISMLIDSKGGRYMEAQIQGSKAEAHDGNLIVLGAGDKSLFHECSSCFKSMAKAVYHLGEIGFACKMNLAVQVMKGITLAGIAEGFALAENSGIASSSLDEIVQLTGLSCPYVTEKTNAIVTRNFRNVQHSVQNMQKDFRLSLQIAETLIHPLIMASKANEVYKHAKSLGYESHDVAAVFLGCDVRSHRASSSNAI